MHRPYFCVVAKQFRAYESLKRASMPRRTHVISVSECIQLLLFSTVEAEADADVTQKPVLSLFIALYRSTALSSLGSVPLSR